MAPGSLYIVVSYADGDHVKPKLVTIATTTQAALAAKNANYNARIFNATIYTPAPG